MLLRDARAGAPVLHAVHSCGQLWPVGPTGQGTLRYSVQVASSLNLVKLVPTCTYGPWPLHWVLKEKNWVGRARTPRHCVDCALMPHPCVPQGAAAAPSPLL